MLVDSRSLQLFLWLLHAAVIFKKQDFPQGIGRNHNGAEIDGEY